MCCLLNNLIERFGWLRLGLAALTVTILFTVPQPRAETILAWPEVVPTLIAPAIAPLVFMVLALDLLMARVMGSGGDDFVRRRFRRITWFNLTLIALLLARWTPFFIETMSRPT